jgi:hypothetical protein
VNARQRLLQQVAREKKIVPIAQSQLQAQPQSQSQTQPAIAAFGRSGSVLSIEEYQPRPRRSILAFTGWAVAAVLAVAVTVQDKDRKSLSDNLAAQSGQIARLTAGAASAHELLDALTDPRAVRVSLTGKSQPKSGPSGGVTYNPEKGTLIFLASDLDPLQAYKSSGSSPPTAPHPFPQAPSIPTTRATPASSCPSCPRASPPRPSASPSKTTAAPKRLPFPSSWPAAKASSQSSVTRWPRITEIRVTRRKRKGPHPRCGPLSLQLTTND